MRENNSSIPISEKLLPVAVARDRKKKLLLALTTPIGQCGAAGPHRPPLIERTARNNPPPGPATPAFCFLYVASNLVVSNLYHLLLWFLSLVECTPCSLSARGGIKFHRPVKGRPPPDQLDRPTYPLAVLKSVSCSPFYFLLSFACNCFTGLG